MLNMYKMFKSTSRVARELMYHVTGGILAHSAIEAYRDTKKRSEIEAQEKKNKPE